MEDYLASLTAEINKFKAWAAAYHYAGIGEWECNYGNWRDLYRVFERFIYHIPFQLWTQETIDLILYAIARDNDIEELIDVVARDPERLIFLAERAVTSTERDAKWQFAVALGRVDQQLYPTEALLTRLMDDENEYVRRRALHALADIGSAKVTEMVKPAWESNHEYQRMTVLYALWKIDSPLLIEYLEQAMSDGRTYLMNYAQRIRAGHP